MESEWKTQNTGIRQGCPLSPYLFILTIHVLFHDVNLTRLSMAQQTSTIFPTLSFRQLLYADDTLLIARSPYLAQKVLQLVETESAYYGFILNKGKCSPVV